VLSLRGRYLRVDEELGVKETTVTEGGRTVRYLLCYDENRARREAETRAEILGRLAEELPPSPPAAGRHTKGMCRLLSQPGYARFLTEDARGLRIDRAKVKAEERLDGKYVLMTNELELPAEELVRGYRDIWRAERAFRSMKSLLDIEPVHHRTTERIVAHVHLCVLAYRLILQ